MKIQYKLVNSNRPLPSAKSENNEQNLRPHNALYRRRLSKEARKKVKIKAVTNLQKHAS
jgi:hypothetical protein